MPSPSYIRALCEFMIEYEAPKFVNLDHYIMCICEKNNVESFNILLSYNIFYEHIKTNIINIHYLSITKSNKFDVQNIIESKFDVVMQETVDYLFMKNLIKPNTIEFRRILQKGYKMKNISYYLEKRKINYLYMIHDIIKSGFIYHKYFKNSILKLIRNNPSSVYIEACVSDQGFVNIIYSIILSGVQISKSNKKYFSEYISFVNEEVSNVTEIFKKK